MQAVILAAGQGKRLYPFTANCTKAMAPIVGKPIVARVMEMFMRQGINDFVIVINPTDAKIGEYFAAHWQDDSVSVRLVPQTERLGMAHALMQAAPLIEEDFILSACDNLVEDSVVAQLIDRMESDPALSAVLVLKPVAREKISSTGIVAFDGERIVGIVEKPAPEEAPSNIASLPLYLFTKRLLDYLPEVPLSARGEYELQDAIQMLLERDGQIVGVRTDWRITLTNVDDLYAMNQFFLRKDQPAVVEDGARVAADAELIAPYYIESGARVESGAKLGPNVYVGAGCAVGANVVIADSLVLERVQVGDGEEIRGRLVY
ncbi:MAG: NTP transferase domain-containing protein [Anaerolineaceae bacterium]|nr:NTP transferase domain-containing protein [Anaerolineaceae bacterium]